MGRWSQYDEDSYRLPEGMERVGYDADTQTYIYRDSDNSTWRGEPGARYGQLTQTAPSSTYSSPTYPISTARINENNKVHDLDLTCATPASGSASNSLKSSWAGFATFAALTSEQVYPDDTDTEAEEEKKERRKARRASLVSAARAVGRQGQTGLRRAQTFLSRSKLRYFSPMDLKAKEEKDVTRNELLSTQKLKMGGWLDSEAAEGEEKGRLGEETAFAQERPEAERSGEEEKA